MPKKKRAASDSFEYQLDSVFGLINDEAIIFEGNPASPNSTTRVWLGAKKGAGGRKKHEDEEDDD